MTRRGFTLLELLLATLITALIGLAVAQLVFVSLRADEAISERGAARAQVRALASRLRADFNGLVPPGATYAAGMIGEEAPLGGELMQARDLGDTDPQTVDLSARARLTLAVWEPALAFGVEAPLGEGALVSVIYWLDDDSATEERGLVRQVTRVRDPAPLSDAPPIEELVPDAVAFAASYYDGQAWAETYDSTTTLTLPAGVRLRVWVRTPQGVREQTLTFSPPCSRGSTDFREATQ
ncbi:MAG: prepilin-type N-terminal cleavage/methylation domain-containing protein [Planctomycetes bacterium]|nr:prepilin-type N-terminal cleavage/methylation domain-containing protein [Planctomycetota bacterium]